MQHVAVNIVVFVYYRQQAYDSTMPNTSRSVVALCGSARFRDEFLSESVRLSLDGFVTLLPVLLPADHPPVDEATKRKLVNLHLQKIRMSDGIHVVNPNGYIGADTRREIDYALSLRKTVTYLVEPVIAEHLPKVVFIDWHNTLSSSFFFASWENTEEYEVLQSVLFGSDSELVNKWMRGKLTYVEVLRTVSERTGISYSDLFNKLVESIEDMRWLDATVFDDISRLRGMGVQVVIASDNMDVFGLWTVENLGLHSLFDDVLLSSDIGRLKSDGGFFDAWLERHSILPSDAVLVDDSDDAVLPEGMGFLHVNADAPLRARLTELLA